MKIASITIYCNEDLRLACWKEYYEEYKDDLYLHVIVNNGKEEDNALLASYFPDSILLFSKTKNMTACYNLALREILKYKEVQVVAQITNDVRFCSGAFVNLANELLKDKSMAAIGPVMLIPNSNIIDGMGMEITGFRGPSSHPNKGKALSSVLSGVHRVSCVPGGTVFYKRSAIEKIGFQDENIYMYSDERDLYIRFALAGYYEAISTNAIAWHIHQNRPGAIYRNSYSAFFSARNRIYITKKYNTFWGTFLDVLDLFFKATRLYLVHFVLHNVDGLSLDKASFRGIWAGIVGNMDNSFMDKK